ncbi:beta-glucanase (plasmid) [Streptomyces sp. BI20]|uniref:beta-glucanase n=1 Tax=Streptomyces sp. BI20 TaxID=3403460 RepID=UPI003C75A472
MHDSPAPRPAPSRHRHRYRQHRRTGRANRTGAGRNRPLALLIAATLLLWAFTSGHPGAAVGAAAPPPRPPTAGKRLVFAEDFTKPAWGRRWRTDRSGAYRYGTHNPADDKLDWLDSRAITLDKGTATLTATPNGPRLRDGRRTWRTALMTTEGSREGFRVRVGDYIETRVVLPADRGAWPGLWTWRDGGNEVDVFEYHADAPGILEFANQVRPSGTRHSAPAAVAPGRPLTVGLLLGSRSNTWYVGGRRVYEDRSGVGAGWSAYLVLNLSVSAGRHHPAPRGTRPLRMSVAHVHVWRPH